MTLLLPLGLLGLLGIAGLILIYVIRPNYQQKIISSTYIWKLSLKYKKKRIPVSKINHILLFICQLLIIGLCAFLLATPVVMADKAEQKGEKIVIIDASAGMLMETQAETRYERALSQVKEFAQSTTEQGNLLSIIVASEKAYFLAQRSGADDIADILTALTDLDGKCTYGAADIEGAVELSEQVLIDNPEAEVFLYTATEYIDKSGINVVNVGEEGEWNAAVLGCEAVLEDSNYYSFEADVGCFGRTDRIVVFCDITGFNGDPAAKISLSKGEYFDSSEDRKIIKFAVEDFSTPLYSFDTLHVYVSENDSFEEDNSFWLYGRRQPIKIQYASTMPNNFFSGVLRTYRQQLKQEWDIQLTEVRVGQQFATEGFDLYIFEHEMPAVMPTDGVVVLMDLNRAPEGSGILLGPTVPVNKDTTLASGETHPVTQYVNADSVTVAAYQRIISSDGYTELLYCNADPVLLVRNEPDSKVAAVAWNIHQSNAAIEIAFPILFYNLFRYFFPATVGGYAYEIGDAITLNARGTDLTVSGPDLQIKPEELPAEIAVTRPGTYTLTQNSMKGDLIIEDFFVRIPNSESDIAKEVDRLPSLHVDKKTDRDYKDLLVYFAAALVALLFVEWLLQSREYFR